MEPDCYCCVLIRISASTHASYECNDDQTERPIHSNGLIEFETMTEVQANVMEPQ